jgi:predicted ATPase
MANENLKNMLDAFISKDMDAAQASFSSAFKEKAVENYGVDQAIPGYAVELPEVGTADTSFEDAVELVDTTPDAALATGEEAGTAPDASIETELEIETPAVEA